MNHLRRKSHFFRELYHAIGLLSFLLILAGCSASDGPTPKLFTPPQSLNNPIPVSARSPSAMEAISRGVAAVTPPGAALKDVYYQFDSVELAAEAQEILKRNAEWLKANP
jgi:outer membrane protein OmpA-like peptidoglycan-associated protein